MNLFNEHFTAQEDSFFVFNSRLFFLLFSILISNVTSFSATRESVILDITVDRKSRMNLFIEKLVVARSQRIRQRSGL